MEDVRSGLTAQRLISSPSIALRLGLTTQTRWGLATLGLIGFSNSLRCWSLATPYDNPTNSSTVKSCEEAHSTRTVQSAQ